MFGRWTVVGYAEMRSRIPYWNCMCECGTLRAIGVFSLQNGTSTSCGCLARELLALRKLTHGMSGRTFRSQTPEYTAWISMQQRCYNKNIGAYADYGGRGVTVCDKWRDSFSAFLGDIGVRPSSRHSVDRIDTNGNYEPSNVRWSSPEEQQRNKRSNRMLTFQGETLCVAAWAERLGIGRTTISQRLRRGWPVDLVLSTRA